MLHYLLKKLAQLAITMVGVAALIFFLLHVLPGDIVEVKFRSEGGQVSEAVLQQERARLGLDRPLPAQFLDWMGGLARLDLDKSMWTDRPVAEEIAMRFSITLEVALLAMIIGTLIAIPMGVGAALAHGRWADQFIRVFTVAGLAVPPFWLGMLLLLALLLNFGWLPPIQSISFRDDPLGHLSQIVFPALVAGWRLSAMIARMLRSSMLEVLNEEYIRTARSKGVPEWTVVMRHALGNALLPTITVMGVEFAMLLGGLVVTEQVFNLNGVGRLLVQAVSQNDFTLIQGLVMLFAVFFVLANFAVDILYAVLDPRVRSR
jgi:peptide/nickel transport system permease protein